MTASPTLTGLNAGQTNISTTGPLLGAMHNSRRAINLLRPRTAEKGSRGAAVLAQVEVDIDILRLRTKRVLRIVGAQVVHLDHDRARAGVFRGQSPTHAAGPAWAGARAAAVDGLRDGGVVARAAIPGAGCLAGVVAGGVLGEAGGRADGVVAAGGGGGAGVGGAGAGTRGLGVRGRDGVRGGVAGCA